MVDETQFDGSVVVGHVAHIVARSPDGPRGVEATTPRGLQDESNLILLCAHHHALVDAQSSTYTADDLRRWKAEHRRAFESFSRAVLPGIGNYVSPDLVGDEYLDEELVILLEGANLFGKPVYSYIKLIGHDLKRLFEAMQMGRNFNPSDFGEVLDSGEGEPLPETRQHMARAYHMMSIDLPDIP